MVKFRTYGNPPFQIALIHGGPGAAGEMEPVARALSEKTGILEPIQNELTVQGQIDELHEVLLDHADSPVILIGHSWGAWLSFIYAAKYPAKVKKLILVGSGPFEEHFVEHISANRLNRLSEVERTEYLHLLDVLHDADSGKEKGQLDRLGELAGRADRFEPLSELPCATPAKQLTENPERIYAGVWPEAAQLRKSGELLRLGSLITCPVVAIHGRQDPHPFDGVQEPLSRILKDFRMVVLDRCGHTPWLEKYACDAFYALLEKEIMETDR